MNKLISYISFISILSAIGIVLLITYWLVYPYHPIKFNEVEFPVLQEKVIRDKTLTYIVDYCKNANLPATLTRSFTNGIIFVMPSFMVNNPVGCHVVNAEVQIPTELPLGNYQLKMIYEYQMNPLRKIIMTQYTEEFEVIEAGVSGKVK